MQVISLGRSANRGPSLHCTSTTKRLYLYVPTQWLTGVYARPVNLVLRTRLKNKGYNPLRGSESGSADSLNHRGITFLSVPGEPHTHMIHTEFKDDEYKCTEYPSAS